jgi:hypothetical protein
VAARAEIPRLAGKGEDAAVPALTAAQPGEAVMRVAASEEPFDDVFGTAAGGTAGKDSCAAAPGKGEGGGRFVDVR